MAFGFNFGSGDADKEREEVPRDIDICIISGQQVTEKRYKVKDDFIISGIRAIKEKFGLATNNRLYVSPENYEIYRKKRSKFEQKVVLLGAFGVIVSIFVIGANLLLRGTIDLVQIASSIALTLFLIALGFVDYIPAVADLYEKPHAAEEAVKKQANAPSGQFAPSKPKPAQAASAKPMSGPAQKASRPKQKSAKRKR